MIQTVTIHLAETRYRPHLRPDGRPVSEIALYATTPESNVRRKFSPSTMWDGRLFLYVAPTDRPFCPLATAKSFELCHAARRQPHPFHRLWIKANRMLWSQLECFSDFFLCVHLTRSHFNVQIFPNQREQCGREADSHFVVHRHIHSY